MLLQQNYLFIGLYNDIVIYNNNIMLVQFINKNLATRWYIMENEFRSQKVTIFIKFFMAIMKLLIKWLLQ